jgi:hypothetical protein
MTVQVLTEALTDEQIVRYEQQLLETLGDEPAKGNVKLMRELGWTEEMYWRIRNRLIDRGVLEKGRGKGGSVRRVDIQPPPVTTEVEIHTSIEGLKPRKLREIDIYPAIINTISKSWVGDHGFETFAIESSGKRGSQDTGGKWSRPDITLATYTTYAYVPGKHFDVVTFEVKIAEGFNVTAVYEALAHRRAATRSWVLLYVTQPDLRAYEDEIEDVQAEAKRHGIGLIVATDLDDYEAWDERLPAERYEPDPYRLNEFVSKLNLETKEKLNRWFR